MRRRAENGETGITGDEEGTAIGVAAVGIDSGAYVDECIWTEQSADGADGGERYGSGGRLAKL